MAINDSGSNYQFADKLEKPRVPKSLFDLSFLNTMTIPKEGLLFPIALFETLPNENWSLDVSCLLRVLPQVLPLYSRQRIFVHAYYSRYQELWNDAEVFITKGYTGNENLLRPSISANNFDPTLLSGTVQAESLADYLGLPIGAKYSDLATAGISALPFMMYERIYRDYYMNKNFYTTSRQWLPNDDGDLRLNSEGYVISTKGQANNEVLFGNLHYRDWTQDYFTSALPWPQRGDMPSVDLNLSNVRLVSGNGTLLPLQFATPLPTGVYQDSSGSELGVMIYNSSETSGTYFSGSSPFSNNAQISGHDQWVNVAGGSGNGGLFITQTDLNFPPSRIRPIGASIENLRLSSLAGGIQLSAEDFRTLFVNQSILEKTARTDGSYTEFGYAFFGVSSKASRSYRPTYIGGTYQPIVFTEVLQNSQTTDSSPLGAQAGHGISSTPNNMHNIGNCFSDDYGYIMILGSIMPDTYYSQGLPKMWTRSTQADMYLPERAKLGMQAILNQELYFSGNQTQDIDVWAYQSRYDELRYSPNTVHGKIADPSALSFFPYTQSRYFGSLPGYSADFARASDVRGDVFFAPSESHYSAQFAVRAKVARPLPYKAIPATII